MHSIRSSAVQQKKESPSSINKLTQHKSYEFSQTFSKYSGQLKSFWFEGSLQVVEVKKLKVRVKVRETVRKQFAVGLRFHSQERARVKN